MPVSRAFIGKLSHGNRRGRCLSDANASFFSITDEFRIAFQFLSEKIERSASLFRLLHETVVSFVFIQQDGIVDMGDGMSLGCELLAQQNILIAVVSEVLIKGQESRMFLAIRKLVLLNSRSPFSFLC